MFKWGEREKQQHFFQTHFMHQRQAKIGPGPIKKNICEIILNTLNVPNGKVPGCTADTSPHAKYCTFLEGAAERKDIIKAIDKPPHTTAGPSPATLWGHTTTGTRPQWVLGSVVKPLQEAGGDHLPFQAGKEPLKKKNTKPHKTSKGLGNELSIKKPG